MTRARLWTCSSLVQYIHLYLEGSSNHKFVKTTKNDLAMLLNEINLERLIPR